MGAVPIQHRSPHSPVRQRVASFDPIDVVPYDWDKYVQLSRDSFCLVSGPSMGSVGQLLDTWSEVQFDQASSTLLLAVLRPVSTPYRVGGQLLCKVERHWVAVELEEDAQK
jgi:hypothetical protein